MTEEKRPETMDTTLRTVGDIVAADFRTAKIFEKYGIDFCCGGRVTLEAACQERGLEPAALRREIEEAQGEPVARSENYAAWELSFLADYIVNTHHAYFKENAAPIAAYARKIAEVHGAHHPEAIEIAGIFEKIATDMATHIREEEEVLFPAVKRIDAARKGGTAPGAADVATLRECLAKLHDEHDEIGAAVHTIRRLAGDYAVPADVCTTYALTYRLLREFEDDLHKHVHLENNILFPKAALF